MYKVTTELTYYAPDGLYCNIEKQHCRFCVKHKDGYSCSLYQETLEHHGKTVLKTNDCTYRKLSHIVEEQPTVAPTMQIDPQEVIKMAVDSFLKIYDSLRSQGFPEEMARQLAKKEMRG